MKLILILFLIFSSFCINAQEDRVPFLKEFDVIEYYPDSTIMLASKSNNGLRNGYAIEFSKDGSPNFIGEYLNGKRVDTWQYYNGYFGSYDNKANPEDDFVPTCGTAMNKAVKSFEKLYISLVYPNKKKKK